MEKRAIVAIILSLAVWLLWSYFFLKPKGAKQPEQVARQEEPERQPARETPAAVRSGVSVLPAGTVREQQISVSTKGYTATLSTRGAAITSFKYGERAVELVVGENIFKAKGSFDFALHFGDEEFMEGNELDSAVWGVFRASDSDLTFYTNLYLNGSPVRLEKRYSFKEELNYFTVTYVIVNNGFRDIVFPKGRLVVSPSEFLGPSMDFKNTYNSLSSIYSLKGDFEKTQKGGGFFSKRTDLEKENGASEWVGVMSRYFLLIMMPDGFTGSGVICDNREDRGYRTGMYLPASELKARGQLLRSFKIYVGEKDKKRLGSVSPAIVDAADINKWIEPIRDFLLWSLLKINILVGNLGWSLVIFSIITKVLLMPLTLRSTESMKKLQALNPQINEIREKYKDKPEQLNKKIMEIYKKNKVNPMSGCLPMLLQLPFFFALYSALINSIDLWQAPFMLWISDLSLPDTVYQLQGFNINILPILMTGTTFLQQKMSSGEMVGQQQKMMMLMPLVFIVIFWNMPSGLVLYWTMQNALQIAHQLYVNKWGKKENG